MGLERSRLSKAYGEGETTSLNKITSKVLGNEIIRRFGEEDRRENLNERDKKKVQLLRYAIDFIPKAFKLGIDFTNAAFIFAQTENELVIKAGNGDWEFLFQENVDGEISGECVREGSTWRYIWNIVRGAAVDAVKALWKVVLDVLLGKVSALLELLNEFAKNAKD